MAKKTATAKTATAADTRRSRVPARAILVLVVVVLAIWFVVANTAHVRIHLWIGTLIAPMWAVLLCCLLGGGFIGWYGTHRRVRR